MSKKNEKLERLTDHFASMPGFEPLDASQMRKFKGGFLDDCYTERATCDGREQSDTERDKCS